MAKKINLGKVGITTEGAYDSSKAYEKLSCVTYNYESWVSTKDVPAGNVPDIASPFWQKMSARGEQGIQGPVGPQGNSAFDGNGVEIVNNLTQGGEAAVLSAEQGKILKKDLTELSEDTDARFAESTESTSKQIQALEDKTDVKFSNVANEIGNIKPIINQGTINNAADEEDLTSENSLLKLKDRSALNGMGYVILRKNKSFAEQVKNSNTIYEIRYNFDVGGTAASPIVLPSGCVLKFNGGVLAKGYLHGNATTIDADVNQIFANNINLSGTWNVDKSYLEWFDNTEDYAYSSLAQAVKVFKRVDILSDTIILHDLQLNDAQIYNHATITTKAAIRLKDNNVIEGGVIEMCCPYWSICVVGDSNKVKNIKFAKSAEYDEESIDAFIEVTRLAHDTSIQSCVFGNNALSDVLVAGENTYIDSCHFLTHESDNAIDVKKAAVKCTTDARNPETMDNLVDFDETATGADGLYVTNCIFDYHTDNAVDTFTAGKNLIFENNVFNESKEGSVEIKIAYRTPGGQGTCYNSGRYSENIRFVKNTFNSYVTLQGMIVVDNLKIESPKAVQHIYFEGNTFNVSDTAFRIVGSSYIYINNNYFRANSTVDSCLFMLRENVGEVTIANNDIEADVAIIDCRGAIPPKKIIFKGNSVKILKSIIGFPICGEEVNISNNCFYNAKSQLIYPFRSGFTISRLILSGNYFENCRQVIFPHRDGTSTIDYILAENNSFKGDCVRFIENSGGPSNILLLKNNVAHISKSTFAYYSNANNFAYLLDDNNMVKDGEELVVSNPKSGTVRPINPNVGDSFLDTKITPPKPLWWNGESWVDATGASV